MKKPSISFYNVKTKKKISIDNYKLTFKKTSRGLKYFAIASLKDTSYKLWRLVKKDFYDKYK